MSEITDLVDGIFDAVDAKDWDATEAMFTDEIAVDFTSLNGGEPARITSGQLVDGWRQGLHPKKKSFHLVAHHRVRGGGDEVTVTMKGYAYNVLDDDLGRHVGGVGIVRDAVAAYVRGMEGDRAVLLSLAYPR